MIGLIILPIILVFDYFLFKIIIKWLSLIHKSLDNKILKICLYSSQIIITICLLISLLSPSGSVRRIFYLIGNYWFGTLIYALLIFLVAALIKHIFQKKIRGANSRKIYLILGTVSTILLFGSVIYSSINANIINVKKYDVKVNKKANLDDLKIVMITDLHMGYNLGINQVKKIVDKINSENPDIVLFGGDIFDNEYKAIDNPVKTIEILKNIKSKYGVYAVYGNHDVEDRLFLGFSFHKKNENLKEMEDFLEEADIDLLQDEYVLIEDSIYIYGRIDYSKLNENKEKRKSIKEITKDIDKDKTLIILDHQPKELKELSENGVDLDLSGHTHAGQFFPLSIPINLVWNNGYGLKKYGNMTSIVSSGIGTYGPKFRLFSQAEIVSVKIRFEKK